MKTLQIWLTIIGCLLALALAIMIFFKRKEIQTWLNRIPSCFKTKVNDDVTEVNSEGREVEPVNNVIDKKEKVCDNDQEEISSVIVEQPKTSYDERWEIIQKEDEKKKMEIKEEFEQRAAQRANERAARRLQDNLDFVTRYPTKYQLDQNGEVIPIQVEDDDGIDVNDNFELDSTNKEPELSSNGKN